MGIPILKVWNEETQKYESVPAVSGKPGKDGYTPVKGTDYWTEADKAEITADVQASLLDPIVEVGEGNGFTYRKYASGRAECVGVFTETVSNYGSVAGYYAFRSRPLYYPITFIEAPTVLSTPRVGAGALSFNGGDIDVSKTYARVYALSPTRSGEQACVWPIFAIGRWK